MKGWKELTLSASSAFERRRPSHPSGRESIHGGAAQRVVRAERLARHQRGRDERHGQEGIQPRGGRTGGAAAQEPSSG